MKVIIPLAGFGTRMRPHTYRRPKPLINVAGKPTLQHLLDKFQGLPITEFIFITGWLGDQIEAFVREHYPNTPSYFFDQKVLDGQSTALYLAKDHISGPVVILFVDTIFETDLSFLKDIEHDGVAFVKAVEDPRRFGVAVTDAQGYVTEFVEKPNSLENNQVVIGMYYLKEGRALVQAIEQQLAQKVQTKGEYYLTDALTIMVRNGARLTTHPVGLWLDAGTVEATLQTNRALLERGEDNSSAAPLENSVIIPPVNIHPSARIISSVIGPYATISADCVIESSILRDCIVDKGTTVCDMLLEHSLIGQETTLTGRFQSLNVGDTSSVE